MFKCVIVEDDNNFILDEFEEPNDIKPVIFKYLLIFRKINSAFVLKKKCSEYFFPYRI